MEAVGIGPEETPTDGTSLLGSIDRAPIVFTAWARKVCAMESSWVYCCRGEDPDCEGGSLFTLDAQGEMVAAPDGPGRHEVALRLRSALQETHSDVSESVEMVDEEIQRLKQLGYIQ